ncbi:MAG: 4-alpha-glucanotransferase [Lachnospiraceae bacterium]|nr:4-alpha-glucanotransferase [Lachnospiraceae bacterium]
MRSSGILLPVASLPGKYGIGSFSKEAYKFVDDLKEAGQNYWQILPLGPTGYGDSPYQSFSTFAGNPYFIDLDTLIEEGLLKESEVNSYDWGSNKSYIDYEKIWLSRFKVLKIAFERFDADDKEYRAFTEDNSFWLDDYALYMAVKNSFGGVSFIEWDEDIRKRDSKAIEKYKEELKEEIEFYKFQQFKFNEQWNKLKAYANKNGIKIIGDIPIYVAFDSADTWANPELFQFDEEGLPTGVAGCPPDAFSATGQLWGNPLYRWDYHKKTDYEWWIKRIKNCYKLYDVVRIDHFRGFDEYYNIPYGDSTAEFGKWEKGPGIELFKAIKKELGEIDIIAEDLGFLTESVLELVKETGYPGMKVLEFAFDSREESDYLPHNYTNNSVVYTGTHDNNTLKGWFNELTKEDKAFVFKYLDKKKLKKKTLHWDFIRLAMGSVANLCVIPVQDYLGLGAEARINTPSTLGNNWKWRMSEGALSKELLDRIYKITKLYSRL